MHSHINCVRSHIYSTKVALVGTDTGIAAWEALLRVHAELVPTLGDELLAATGLRLSWYDVLLELKRAEPAKLRMQDLGDRVVLSRTRVSRIVDAAAEAGLVVREPDLSDGRATLCGLTAAGATALRHAAPIYMESIANHFTSKLTAHELAIIQRALGRLVDHRRDA